MSSPHHHLLVVIVGLCLLISGTTGAPASAQIVSLPGLPATEMAKLTPQYSGYVTVDEQAGRALFYWFATAQTANPTAAPLLVWLQGGPGCSSLIGLFAEHGPVRMAPAGSANDLEINGWSWNRLANVLYIEAPAGVGFSYSNTSSDYKTDNEKTAQDNYVFLQNWLQLYPEYAASPLWLSGESYAGDYVPQLAKKIIDGNNTALSQQLTGLMIGNPVLDCDGWKAHGNSVLIQSWYNHGMIPLDLYVDWEASGCPGGTLAPQSPRCKALQERIRISAGVFDPDDLYTDACTGNASLDIDPVTPQCSTFQSRRNAYLNRVDVQQAIHARVGLTYWVPCTNASSQLQYTTDWPNMLPYYAEFTAKRPDMRVMIYSGDVDIATCPLVYTQLCIREMNRTVVADWRPWTIEKALAGYVQNFVGLTLATIKGAGHEAPQFAPRAAFNLIQRFLADKPISP